MKKIRILLLVAIMLMSFSSLAFADTKKAEDEDSIRIVSEVPVDELLYNSGEPFAIVEEVVANNGFNLSSTSSTNVTLTKPGGLLGAWKYEHPGEVITWVNITMTLQYRENFLHGWSTVDEVDFNYPGGLGSEEMNEETWYTHTEGTYRACISGTITYVNGYATIHLSCSGALFHNGGIWTLTEPDVTSTEPDEPEQLNNLK